MTVVVKWLILVDFRAIIVGYYLEDYEMIMKWLFGIWLLYFFVVIFLVVFFEIYKVKMVLR